MINEEQNYLMLKKSIRIKDCQRCDIEKNIIKKHGKRTGVDEILKGNEKQSLKLKAEV